MHTNEVIVDNEVIDYPWLVFNLIGRLFAVNSEITTSILQIPNLVDSLPGSANNVRGIINLRGNIIPLIDLRITFDMITVEEEYTEFKNMIDGRKKDHLIWVEELKKAVDNNTEFKLATDPHKCAFGMWYDNFTTNIQSIKHHLNKIDQPHKKLHKAALEVSECKKGDESKIEECIKAVMQRVDQELMPNIVSLLDETKEVFKNNFREMVVVLDNGHQQIGIIVDEVIAVEQLKPVCGHEELLNFYNSNYIKGVAKSETSEDLIMMLNHNCFF